MAGPHRVPGGTAKSSSVQAVNCFQCRSQKKAQDSSKRRERAGKKTRDLLESWGRAGRKMRDLKRRPQKSRPRDNPRTEEDGFAGRPEEPTEEESVPDRPATFLEKHG
ncbi:hypothetical protein NDU88_006138 [Pleurodeles waltl]|uniref:Uncharacterized protein n=1 Tax=Pleurodeles waltl TaxID=8319 RepID=A0AAV7QMR4_PLEWA|nr:hypothetical protein NDU88_006138 [Pleurodeles waltl]